MGTTTIYQINDYEPKLLFYQFGKDFNVFDNSIDSMQLGLRLRQDS